jgi:branched-chain amino acid transport system substrate-binding protein
MRQTVFAPRPVRAALLRFVVAACAAFAGAGAAAQIQIGQTAGFSGPVAAGVKETSDGARLYIDYVNRTGGVARQQIELIQLDDRFDPKLAGENARVLIEDRQVAAMFLTRGTPHTEAVMAWLDRHGVPLIAPSTGAMVLHAPLQRQVFNVRSTYQREAEKAVRHFSTMGIRRMVVVHADDSFGRDALEGAARGFAELKLQPLAVIKADRSKPVYEPIVEAIMQTRAQGVLWFGSGNAVADGVHRVRAAGSAAQVLTLSNNASSGFIKSLGANSKGVVVTQVFPSERSVGYAFVSEASKLAKAANLDLSPAMLEGFAAAKVLVEALRRASPRFTRERILAALESMDRYDLGGLQLGFSSSDHTGLDFVDLSIIGSDGRFRR